MKSTDHLKEIIGRIELQGGESNAINDLDRVFEQIILSGSSWELAEGYQIIEDFLTESMQGGNDDSLRSAS